MKSTIHGARLLVVAAAILCLCQGIAVAQWQKDNQTSFQLTKDGEILPPRGIYPGVYYTGVLEVGKGEDENQLVVRTKLVSVTPRANQLRQPESPENGVLLCKFYEKPPVGMTQDESREIEISAGDQARQDAKNGDQFTIKVPDHASFVELTLQMEQFPKHEVAIFMVSRPYREDAMRRVKAERARDAEKQAADAGKQVIQVDCTKCNGTGKTTVPEEKKQCPRCNGEGWYPPGKGHMRARCGQDSFAKSFGEKGCGGSGQITVPAHDVPCDACGGAGKVRQIVDKPKTPTTAPASDARN